MARKAQTQDAHVMAYKDHLVQAPKAPAKLDKGTKHYALGAKAPKEMRTLSTTKGKTGLGRAWRGAASAGRNTRMIAMEAIAWAMDDEGNITEDQALAALSTVKDQLGSGSPRSYLRAFVATGYLAQA